MTGRPSPTAAPPVTPPARDTPPVAPRPGGTPMVTQWARDLALGLKFAFTGGREGWIRALLTGVGVGLGVALLLLTTAVPNAMQTRSDREYARMDLYSSSDKARSDKSLLVANMGTQFHGSDIRGRVLEPEGPRAPLPPGVSRFPAPGEMIVSPALEELLGSEDAGLLRERLPYRIAGTIGEPGLIGSAELAFYTGGKDLARNISSPYVIRIDAYHTQRPPAEELDPVLLLLVLTVFVVLLMPVGVFIATAVRFGGERRDRRLAALRLVGADSRMTRRIAAGEALAGAVVGLAFGVLFFLLGRQLAGSVEVFRFSVFPSYLDPSPLLALLVAVAVPAAAIAVTLLALRGVVIEPLGVVRTARPARRRLWWRLLLPLGGLGLLAPMIGKGTENGEFNEYMVTGGVVLLLVGVTALLPWVVEAVVARLGPGPVSWQLAVRRLQLSSGSAARMVNGIAVAVAGAIALQMLFAGVEDAYTKPTGEDLSRAQMQMSVPQGVSPDDAARRLAGTRGVRDVITLANGEAGVRRKDADASVSVTIGDCDALREAAKLSSCRPGDVFFVRATDPYQGDPRLVEPGRKLWIDPSYTGGEKGAEVAWTVPRDIRTASSRPDPTGWEREGLMMTPEALPAAAVPALGTELYLGVDMAVPDVREIVRNAAVKVDPLTDVMEYVPSERSERYDSIRSGLFVGAAGVLALIGVSLLVSQLEQLRERRKLLSALVAFGTRRRTLSLSVLWQTAVPVALGLVLAAAVGLTLGAVLLKMTNTAVTVDWVSVLSMTGIGAAVVLVVTALSIPPLLRLMRPDGLRTE